MRTPSPTHLLTLLLVACHPPPLREVAPPEPAVQDEPTAAVPAATLPPAEGPDEAAFSKVPLPELLPATVYTRTAPASLVDERGTPLQVLTGHHTRLELRHIVKERALVACELCPTPTEGWIQVHKLMPADHLPTDAELADERLELALYVAALRRALEGDGTFPDREPSDAERTLLLRLMDQGFAWEDREAMAPASGGAYAREGASILLRRKPDGWKVKAVELPEAAPEAPGHTDPTATSTSQQEPVTAP